MPHPLHVAGEPSHTTVAVGDTLRGCGHLGTATSTSGHIISEDRLGLRVPAFGFGLRLGSYTKCLGRGWCGVRCAEGTTVHPCSLTTPSPPPSAPSIRHSSSTIHPSTPLSLPLPPSLRGGRTVTEGAPGGRVGVG
eukprot:1591885-Rhodomonas_salina.1